MENVNEFVCEDATKIRESAIKEVTNLINENRERVEKLIDDNISKIELNQKFSREELESRSFSFSEIEKLTDIEEIKNRKFQNDLDLNNQKRFIFYFGDDLENDEMFNKSMGDTPDEVTSCCLVVDEILSEKLSSLGV